MLRDLGQRADRQALEAHVRGQAERGVEDGGARLLALVQGAAQAVSAGRLSGVGGTVCDSDRIERSFYFAEIRARTAAEQALRLFLGIGA